MTDNTNGKFPPLCPNAEENELDAYIHVLLAAFRGGKAPGEDPLVDCVAEQIEAAMRDAQKPGE